MKISIDTNTQNITDNKTNIVANKQAIADTNVKVNNNTANITTNTNNIATNTNSINNNSNNIAQNSWRLDDQQSQINELDHRVNKGLASVTALTALQPNARSSSDNQIAVGTGYFNGQTAFAVGTFHYITNETLVNTGVSYGGQDSLAVRVGATFGF